MSVFNTTVIPVKSTAAKKLSRVANRTSKSVLTRRKSGPVTTFSSLSPRVQT